MKKRALVFDMDGVLVDSNPVHAEVWREYLSQFGIAADSMMERMLGKRNDQIVRSVFGVHLTDEQVFVHGAHKEALYRQRMRPQLAERLVPGVVAFLERHCDLPMGVASNAERANIDFVLVESNLRRFFQAIVDGHEVAHPKPHPEIYLLAAARLRVEPCDCVIFEDSPAGIAAARAAGARVVSVRTNASALPAADFSIRDFTDPDLDSWLQSLPA